MFLGQRIRCLAAPTTAPTANRVTCESLPSGMKLSGKGGLNGKSKLAPAGFLMLHMVGKWRDYSHWNTQKMCQDHILPMLLANETGVCGMKINLPYSGGPWSWYSAVVDCTGNTHTCSISGRNETGVGIQRPLYTV